MSTKFIEAHRSDETIKHPFPSMRPDVKIVESSEKISEVDCPELQWWFAVPQMGESYLWANYNGETMELESVTEMTPITAAHIHGIDCVELQVREWVAARLARLTTSVLCCARRHTLKMDLRR